MKRLNIFIASMAISFLFTVLVALPAQAKEQSALSTPMSSTLLHSELDNNSINNRQKLAEQRARVVCQRLFQHGKWWWHCEQIKEPQQ